MIRNFTTPFTRRALVSMAAAMLVGAQTANLDIAQAKGIFRDGGSSANNGSANPPATARAAVKFDVLLMQDGEWRPVSARYEFRSGDKFKFRLQSNRDGYIYLLNRTFNGDNVTELAAKGIERVRTEDSQRRPEGATYRLLYPLKNDGNKVKANHWVVLPGADSFNMDNRPGVEKLYIIVSSQPMRWDNRFDVESGEIRTGSGGNTSNASNNRPRNDRDEDVLSQLNKDLAAYAANGQTAILEQKGIIRTGSDSESYGVVRDSSKPAQFEVSLRHLPR